MRSKYQAIYNEVRKIPYGKLATYGQIARNIGQPGLARQVGYALACLTSDSDIPWHRVVNAQGRISTRSTPGFEELQRSMLADEGIQLQANGQINLSDYQWHKTKNKSVFDNPLDYL